MTNKVVHLISHTHWDREWYMPYEHHHYRLIQLMDHLLELLERDQAFKSFHLDGQTIILDDYLQVRPEKKQIIADYIRDGRIHIGPWYILQDEYLTSSEANVRNLLVGHRDAKPYGQLAKIGYFPDSFGNMGQAPQLLRQAGIDNAVFGRGVKPTGFNNAISDSENYESPFSEMIWEAPDGSQVLGILFANWYNNGMEVPVDPEQAKLFWADRLANVERFASTEHLLLMNGCDHQPIQDDLSAAIRTAEALYPDITFVHSNFPDYVASVQAAIPAHLTVVKGELTSQRTDGWSSLVNTASSRIYLKQLNQQAQTLLERVAEPLAAYAHSLGQAYPHHMFTYAWKTLMQNHPHDSICGCSVDEVHREMVTRFDKSIHLAQSIVEDSIKVIASRLDTSRFAAYGADPQPFVVFNTSGWQRTGVVSIELEVAKLPFIGEYAPQRLIAQLEQIGAITGTIVDADGQPVDCVIEDGGIRFGYTLPNDRFRQPYMARWITVRLLAEQIPALGYAAYAFIPSEQAAAGSHAVSMLVGERLLENRYISAEVANDGSITLTDKSNGRSYPGLAVFEDVGDIGNEYMFMQPIGDKGITTAGHPAAIRIVEDSVNQAVIEVTHEWLIPASADPTLDIEQRSLTPFVSRQAQRSDKLITIKLTTTVTLEREAKSLKLVSKINNQSSDHRLRLLFPTHIQSDVHQADSVFEVVTRNNQPEPEWRNPANNHRQQTFVGLHTAADGLTISGLGLQEYEVLRDGKNTIAITILRATGELGDWGYFPTPEAQCIGEHTVQLEIIPHSGSGAVSGANQLAFQSQVPWTVKQAAVQAGDLPLAHSLIQWSGANLALTSLKVSEQTNAIIVRWFNMETDNTTLEVMVDNLSEQVFFSNILEEHLGKLVPNDQNRYTLDIKKAQIVTVSIGQ